MRVLMVAGASTGGLYSYTDALCSGLCSRGADVTVLTNSLWADLPRPFKVERRLCEFTDKKKQWSKLHWAADRFYRSLINSLRRNHFAVSDRFDIAHFQGVGTPLLDQFFLKSLARQLPIILTVHDVKPHYERFVSRASFIGRSLHIPRRLIVHYEDGKRQLADHWGICSNYIDVIPHGMMPVKNPPDLTDARKKLNLPQDRQIILFFGGIRSNKGLDVLLKALKIIKSQNKRVLLVIAGGLLGRFSFEQYSDMIRKADLSKHVQTFIHFIPEEDVDYFFAASNLVVLPYMKFEAQSGVLLRAYAHKKPVVVSNVGAMGELVSSDNIGLAVEPGAVEPLAKAVLNALDDLDKFQSYYSPELENKYRWEHIAEMTMHSYEAAINKSS
ncbi:MAG: glycosyltransferase family 4 protein [Planctomycetes bacterium]|nr:glycosyltransferase family 4 protein [Planctomycetota bacterium]